MPILKNKCPIFISRFGPYYFWNRYKVPFLDASNDGMSSVIEENVPGEFMSVKHMGTVLKGEEYVYRPEDKDWKAAHENYTLKWVNGNIELHVEMEEQGMDPAMIGDLKGKWPKALEKLESSAEGN